MSWAYSEAERGLVGVVDVPRIKLSLQNAAERVGSRELHEVGHCIQDDC